MLHAPTDKLDQIGSATSCRDPTVLPLFGPTEGGSSFVVLKICSGNHEQLKELVLAHPVLPIEKMME